MSGQNYGSGGYDPNQPQGDQSGYTNPPPADGYSNQPPSGYSNQPPQGGYNQPPQGGYNQPPQGGYNQPPQGGAPNYSAPSSTDVNRMMAQGQADLPLIPGKWIKLISSPTPATISSELPNANWVTAIVSVLLGGIISALIYLILGGVLFGFSFGGFFNVLWESLVRYAIGLGISYAFAVYLFKGRADALLPLGYINALYAGPLFIIYAILLPIAVRLAFSSTSLFFYGLVLVLFWLAVAYTLWMTMQAVFKFDRQTAMYAALSTVALPLLGAVLLMLNVTFLPGFFYGGL